MIQSLQIVKWSGINESVTDRRDILNIYKSIHGPMGGWRGLQRPHFLLKLRTKQTNKFVFVQ